jgi:hypothetical protein
MFHESRLMPFLFAAGMVVIVSIGFFIEDFDGHVTYHVSAFEVIGDAGCFVGVGCDEFVGAVEFLE